MTHREFRRICPDADTAVLFLHGINGTPDHFREFVERVPPEFSVVNLLLKGHGGSVGDFARASMEEWKAQADREVETLLEQHDRLLIAAHSMGTLFAIRQAIKHPGKVRGLFLLAVPLKLCIKPRMLKTSLLVYSGRVKADDLWTQAAVRSYGIGPDRRFWRYIPWAKRYLELFSEIRDVRGQLDKLQTPCCCCQSKKDELVSMGTCRFLRESRFIAVKVLENSGHYYYAQKDHTQLMQDFDSWVRTARPGADGAPEHYRPVKETENKA